MNIFGFSIFSIATWIFSGILIGLIIDVLDKNVPVIGKAQGTVIAGVTGALIGGFISPYFFGMGNFAFSFPSLAMAFVGAWSLSFIERLVFTAREETTIYVHPDMVYAFAKKGRKGGKSTKKSK